MEFPMELTRIEFAKELLHFAGDLGVRVLGEELHVSETVDSNQRKVILGLAQMMQGVGKLDTIGCEEGDLTFLPQQLSLH